MAGVGGHRWTPDEVRTARPDVLDGARWLLYAERLWPGAGLEAELDAPENPTENYVRAQKRKARRAIAELRKVLLPPDEVTDGV